MKRLLWILPLLLFVASCDGPKQTSRGPADWIYVATTGNDGTGDGSAGAPYLTIAHAIGQASAGDTVYVNAGTYTITSQVAVPVGISIMGAGETSILLAGAALEPMFLYESASENTNGNQSISYLTIDGNMTALQAVSVRRRSNVVFDHITVKDCIWSGIEIYGGAGFASTPTTFASGNIIRYSTVENCCSRRDPGIFGALRIGGTVGMEVHDCILTQVGRASTENGNLLYLWGSPNNAFKFYNNSCTKPTTDGVISGNAGGWNFHIESGPCSGAEIYNNTFVGGVALDLAGGNQVKGAYPYSWWVHHNSFSLPAQINKPTSGTHSPMGMDFERTCEDVIVEYNTFSNYPTAINFTTSSSSYTKERIYFRYNIFKNAGYADADYAYHIVWQGASDATGDLAHHMYFYNNVFHANLGRAFFGLLSAYNLNYIYIRNNIFVNAHLNGWMIVPLYCGDLVTLTGSFTYFYIDNNIMYNNANSNNIRYVDGKTMTIASFLNNQVGVDPLFRSASDFHLQSTSPAINAGLSVGLTNDFAGHRVPQNDTVDIGAYEYGDYLVKLPNGKLLKSANGKLLIIH